LTIKVDLFQAALGLGRGPRGDQVLNWHDASYFRPEPPPIDPRGLYSLEHFNGKFFTSIV